MPYAPRVHPPGLAFKCPKCGGGTGVRDSRPTGNMIRRRRKCYSCPHRFTTMEVPYELFTDLDMERIRKDVVDNLNTFIEAFGHLNRSIKAHAKLRELP